MNDSLHTQFVLLLNGIIEKNQDSLIEAPLVMMVTILDLHGDLTEQECSLSITAVSGLYPQAGIVDKRTLIEILGTINSAASYKVLSELCETDEKIAEKIKSTMNTMIEIRR